MCADVSVYVRLFTYACILDHVYEDMRLCWGLGGFQRFLLTFWNSVCVWFSWMSKPHCLTVEKTQFDLSTAWTSCAPVPLSWFAFNSRYTSPRALINACLWDTALKLSLSRSSHPFRCVCTYSSLFYFSPRRASLIWQHELEPAGARQDREMLHQAMKVSFFPPIYKQVVMLRWAIGYYGICPACDISKHLKSSLRAPVLSQPELYFNKPRKAVGSLV